MKLAKKTISASVLESTYVDLQDLAARCDMSQGRIIDTLLSLGRDKALKLHGKTKEPTR